MAGDFYPQPFGLPVSTTVTISECTAAAAPVSFSLPAPVPPKRVVFIELPADLTQDGMDRYYAKLVARLEGTNVVPVILARGAKAVAADGPKYGAEETLGDYTYKVWGETKDEVMAMKAEMHAPMLPPKAGSWLDKEIGDSFGVPAPTPTHTEKPRIRELANNPPVASAEEMFAKINENYAKSDFGKPVVLPADLWDGPGEDKPATACFPPGGGKSEQTGNPKLRFDGYSPLTAAKKAAGESTPPPMWAWESRPGDKEEIAAAHADDLPFVGEIEEMKNDARVARDEIRAVYGLPPFPDTSAAAVESTEETCAAPVILVYTGESGRQAVAERLAAGLRGEAAVVLNRELKLRGLRPDGRLVDPASIRATPDGIAYAFKG